MLDITDWSISLALSQTLFVFIGYGHCRPNILRIAKLETVALIGQESVTPKPTILGLIRKNRMDVFLFPKKMACSTGMAMTTILTTPTTVVISLHLSVLLC